MTDSGLCINAKPPTSGETDIARGDLSIGIQITANKLRAVAVHEMVIELADGYYRQGQCCVHTR
jgi:hypothetical protein